MKNILKRIFQLILSIIISVTLSFLIVRLGVKLDDRVFQKCIDCPSFYLIPSVYILSFLFFIAFIFIIAYAIRKKTFKFWIPNALLNLLILMSIFGSFILLSFDPNPRLPIELKVYPSDQTHVFYDKDILLSDNKDSITGFIIDPEIPLPLQVENGKTKSYQGGTNLYTRDDTDEKNFPCHNKKGEPLTGFLVAEGKSSVNVLECIDGKREGNAFMFIKDEETSSKWLGGWIYSRNGHIRLQTYYKTGSLQSTSGRDNNGKFTAYRYYPNGQLMLKAVVPSVSFNPLGDISSIQQLFYEKNGQLKVYLDMSNLKGLCVFSDGSNRRLTQGEMERYFLELDESALPELGKEIPDFSCDKETR